MKLKVIDTSDGSKTLYIQEIDEQYHSVNGALTESEHVFIKAGFLFHKSLNPTVFEVGFGTGLNCLLTAISADNTKRPTTYISAEKYPLNKNITQQLNYGNLIAEQAQLLFEKIHSCEWNKTVQISKYFQLKKLKSDILVDDLSNLPNCDVIYFDAFGPDKQPEMWQPEILQKIYSATSARGVFVTYSAKGQVRRNLAACGYKMERIPGPPGKNKCCAELNSSQLFIAKK